MFEVNELVKVYLGPMRSFYSCRKKTFKIGIILRKNEDTTDSTVYEVLVGLNKVYMIDHYMKKI